MRLTRSASGYNIRLKDSQHGIPPILLRESSLRHSPDQVTRRSRVGTRAQCFVFQLFADRIGIDRYRITPPRQAEARPLKHLKHETSTKHQCGATIRLEVTILVRLTQVGSWFRNSVTQVKEPAGHRRMSRIDVIDNRVVSLVTLRRRPRSDGFRRASSGLDHGIGASANRPGRWRLVS
jgi:hypothetical protein